VFIDTEPIPDYFRPFVENKTTYRPHYTAARDRLKITGNQEVLLWNERNELTEGSITNFAIFRDQKWITPPLKCGLLDGILRKTLVDKGNIMGVKFVQKEIFKTQLENAEEILLFNSVRGIFKVRKKKKKEKKEGINLYLAFFSFLYLYF